jgi:hypothetical protein
LFVAAAATALVGMLLQVVSGLIERRASAGFDAPGALG